MWMPRSNTAMERMRRLNNIPAMLGSFLALGLVLTGLAGCNKDDQERRYCDQTGCYACVGDRCYPVPGDPTRPDPGTVTTCDNDSACGAGRVCNLGRCETACTDDANCKSGNACIAGRCRPSDAAKCGVTGALCVEDSTCGSGRSCVGRACAAACKDGGCALGQVCLNSACVDDPKPAVAQCVYDVECGGAQGGFRCINAYCMPSCTDAKSCTGGASCVKGVCRADKRGA